MTGNGDPGPGWNIVGETLEESLRLIREAGPRPRFVTGQDPEVTERLRAALAEETAVSDPEANSRDCDARQWGEAPGFVDGHCRCGVCPRCGHHSTSSWYTHRTTTCRVTREPADPHFCCKDPAFGCELQEGSSRR